MRLDLYISDKNNISRSRAKLLIEGGAVALDGKIIKKSSYFVDDDKEHRVLINDDILPYVSRGGLKLEGAVRKFGITLDGVICADIGASTGGFTDCMLKHGAKHIYAVDSGTDQLCEILRNNPAVTSIEGFNARNLNADTFGTKCGFVAADLSFISQTYVLDGIYSVLEKGGYYVGLIKPQFECGREGIGKGGIVKTATEHKRAIDRVFNEALRCGFDILNIIVSPIKGGDGNKEFLFEAYKHGENRLGLNKIDSRTVGSVLK